MLPSSAFVGVITNKPTCYPGPVKSSELVGDNTNKGGDIMEKAGKIPAAVTQEVAKIRAILVVPSAQEEGP